MAAEKVQSEILEQEQDAYRDNLATVDKTGKRVWIYPKKPKGKFYDYRKIVSYILLVVLFGLPWIKWNGQPLVMFNIPETRFIIFGVNFYPQDFHIFVIAMLIGIIFIALFTVIYGRLFCGWVCPQTIFMEMVFRRIEYWIEGDANAQKRLNKSAWTNDKIIKKVLKHSAFILISIFIAHTFLSYIIGVDAVYQILTEPISEHWKGFMSMVVFTAVFYGVFSILREQVCTTICPYGRLQGVLLDENSLAVAYDFERGEPRGKMKKSRKENKLELIESKVLGDCIDCTLCVQVCPTGIDIRNGTQLECVNCTACMDACDEVMEKIDRPLGLIRIDSYNGIKTGRNKIWNSRIAAYSAVLLSLLVLESFLVFSRSNVETLFLRTPGLLYQETDDGYISNLYNYQLINKTNKSYPVEFKVTNIDGVKIEMIGANPITEGGQISEGALFIKIPKEQIQKRKTKLNIQVLSEGEEIDQTKTNFLGPGSF